MIYEQHPLGSSTIALPNQRETRTRLTYLGRSQVRFRPRNHQGTTSTRIKKPNGGKPKCSNFQSKK